MTDIVYTPNQYLVNNLAKARLEYAYNSADKKLVATTEKYYLDLNESEVTFTEFVYNPKTNKHSTTMTCKGRNFALKNITFNQGTLGKMLINDAQYMMKKASLKITNVPGFYYVAETSQLHLLIEKGADVVEAMLMTMCKFDPKTYTIDMHDQYDEETSSAGVVNVNSPIVGGKLYISYVDHSAEEAAALKAEQEKEAAEKAEAERVAKEKAEEEELARMLKEEEDAKAAEEENKDTENKE